VKRREFITLSGGGDGVAVIVCNTRQKSAFL
jgi:hypothetical protein